MKNWFKVTLIFVVVCVFGILAGYLSVNIGSRMLRDPEPSATPELGRPISKLETDITDDLHPTATPTPPQTQQSYTDGFFVQEVDGDICVFRTTEQGERVFSHKLKIALGSMRADDRKRFQDGFSITSQEELLQLIEDFAS